MADTVCLEYESMARHVSWKAGGAARWWLRPASSVHLMEYLEQAKHTAFYPTGLGSNLLVRDGGFDGLIIHTHHALSRIEWQPTTLANNERGWIYAEAGVPSPKLARFAVQHGLAECEWLATIPGTVGGALAMNAGCYGYETWSYVTKVAVWVHGEGYRELSPAEYVIGYRSVKYQDRYVGHELPHIFLGAWFDFPVSLLDVDAGLSQIKVWLTRRIQTQPLNFPNAGSVFRNPDGDFAARLIEVAGLKGYACGGASVSEKHANFIVNKQMSATASDIESLIIDVQQRVYHCLGVHLEPEVRIIGQSV
jgi:UDP-N-acetylmuramate dehydrogenase